MRLLQKLEIDTKKSEEQKQTIDEGVKLAKKVDTLRELASTEQTNLEKFRDASIETIKEEITQASQALDTLINEIREKERQKDIALLPVKQELEELEQLREELQVVTDSLNEREHVLDLRSFECVQREGRVTNEEGRLAIEFRRSAQNLVESEALHRSAQEELKEAREKNSIINLALDIREKEISKKDETISSRESILHEKEQSLVWREKRLIDGERALRDNYKMLEKSKVELTN